MHMLVTGASGLLGSNFCWEARERARVVGIYNQHPVHLPGVETIQHDLTDAAKTRDLVLNVLPDWIVHCAAATDIDACEADPAMAHRLNAEMTQMLARAASEANSGFLFISTDAIFDGVKGDYSENDSPRCINAYAESKLAAEQAALAEHPNAIIARTNMYGWSLFQNKGSLSQWVLNRLESGQGVPGFRDVIFNALLVNDLSNLLLEMMAANLRGIYNVAAGDACSKYEFARMIAEVFGYDPGVVYPVSVDEVNLKAPRSKNLTLNTAKLAAALGHPLPTMREGVERFKSLRDEGIVEQMKAIP